MLFSCKIERSMKQNRKQAISLVAKRLVHDKRTTINQWARIYSHWCSGKAFGKKKKNSFISGPTLETKIHFTWFRIRCKNIRCRKKIFFNFLCKVAPKGHILMVAVNSNSGEQ